MKLPDKIVEIFQLFHKHGYEIWLVGGGVRNLLMDKPFGDVDFTTDATPEEIQKLFPESFYDNAFGTVGVPMAQQSVASSQESAPEIYEITTYRTEQGYTDKRRPDEVKWGKSLEEDLARRDFTINAMAFKVQSSKFKVQNLELTDPFDGQKDLKDKIVRAVGDPDERFGEDALRILRAIRITNSPNYLIL